MFGFLAKGYGWMQFLFGCGIPHPPAEHTWIGHVDANARCLAGGLANVEATELYYKENPQFYLLAIGFQAFGYGLAFAKRVISLASLAMAGCLAHLDDTRVSAMLRQAKEARQQAKQNKAK